MPSSLLEADVVPLCSQVPSRSLDEADVCAHENVYDFSVRYRHHHPTPACPTADHFSPPHACACRHASEDCLSQGSWMQEQNDDASHRPDSAQSVKEIDSAATTLLASASPSKNHSLDQPRKYADIELERYVARVRTKTWQSEEDVDRFSAEGDGHEHGMGELAATAEDDVGGGEDEHLLAHGIAALNSDQRAAATLPDDGEPPAAPTTEAEKKRQVSWRELPRKSQLAILTLARLSEPLTQTSLQSYMFYQLKSFPGPDGTPPSNSIVARQAGLLAAAFTGAQFLTAFMWGRLADWEGLGRKRVILIGLLGTTIGSLGFGFSGSFAVALAWRALGGMLNGNMGVMRTMISEIVREKKFQSRAFLLLPMTFNIGVIVGPLLGGLLADPAARYPGLFGPGGSWGGAHGVWLFVRWPYALPNVVSAIFLGMGALAVLLGLDETLEGLRDRPDWGRKVGKWIARVVSSLLFRTSARTARYDPVATHDRRLSDIELDAADERRRTRSKDRENPPSPKPLPRAKLPIRRMWTPNLLCTLLAHGLLATHVGTFSNLWFIFVSTPRYTPSDSSSSAAAADEDSAAAATQFSLPPHYHPHLPFTFTGGLALPPPAIGTALAILGAIGITLQLLLYPRVSFAWGTVASYRASVLLFPLSYLAAPFLALLPSSQPPPLPAAGPLVWAGIAAVLACQVAARTFALPATAILVNNASPHPSVLATVHALAQTVSSAARTLGPICATALYAHGLNAGVVGVAWWAMAALALLAALAARLVRDGDGHEIWLPGERGDDEVAQRSA